MSFSGLQPGDVVDTRFELARPLGAGTFGEVWVAHDLNDDRRAIALKLLRPHLGSKPRIVQRFVQEIEVLQRVEHPNIVRPITAQTEGEMMYLALELIEGITLKEEMEQRAKSDQPYTFKEVGQRIDAIAGALQAAHDASVVHRDLKPSNIMVFGDPEAPQLRVLDFGIAKLDVTASERTTAGRMLGTLMYMAPEQLRGQDVDARADVFALAVISFELLTLKRLFARDAKARLRPVSAGSVPAQEPNLGPDVMRRIAFEQRPVASQQRPELSVDADAVLAAGLEVQSNKRTTSVTGFAQGLIQALAATPNEAAQAKQERARAETAFAPSSETSVDLPPTAVSPSPLTPDGRVSELTPTPVVPRSDTLEQSRRSDTPPPPIKVRTSGSKTWMLGLAALVALGVVGFLLSQGQRPATVVAPSPEPTKAPVPMAGARAIAKGVSAVPQAVPDAGVTAAPASKTTEPRRRPAKPPVTSPASPPPPAKTEAPDPWRFDGSDPQSVRRTARRLERVAAKLKPKHRAAVQRCAALVGISRSAKELQACLTSYKKALADQ